MTSERRRNSLNSLVELYTVVMGVALSAAVFGVVATDQGLAGVSGDRLLLGCAFLATLVPFHHGAIRHLWDAYLENKNDHIRLGAVIPDFALLFLHALGFVVLALLLGFPGQFAWSLIVLLSVDSLWGAYAYFAASSRIGPSYEGRWAVLNFGSVALLAAYLIMNSVGLETGATEAELPVLLLLFAVVRTAGDYLWCGRFYFPED